MVLQKVHPPQANIVADCRNSLAFHLSLHGDESEPVQSSIHEGFVESIRLAILLPHSGCASDVSLGSN